MKNRGQKVVFQGKTYESIKEFAESQSLPYTRAVSCFRRGMSPEEVFETCQFTAASKARGTPKETTKRIPVEYGGVSYSSLYAAAEKLGLSPGRLYYLCNTKGLSPEEAIEYATTRKLAKPGTGHSPNAKPCTVGGVTYPSREAALNAYKLRRITVYSRMERDGISFEEALILGRNKAVYREPTPSLFYNLEPVSAEDCHPQPVLEDLKASLKDYCYVVQLMKDKRTGLPILFIEGHSYVYYNRQARGLEIISELPVNIDVDTLLDLNAEYPAVKLSMNRKTKIIYISAFQSTKEKNHDIKSLLNTWFSYLCIRDMLLRRFGTGSLQAGI